MYIPRREKGLGRIWIEIEGEIRAGFQRLLGHFVRVLVNACTTELKKGREREGNEQIALAVAASNAWEGKQAKSSERKGKGERERGDF